MFVWQQKRLHKWRLAFPCIFIDSEVCIENPTIILTVLKVFTSMVLI